MKIQLGNVDHIELFVPDRYEAARIYQVLLGFEICRELESWAKPGGPLMISAASGGVKLALFEGLSRSEDSEAGFYRIAFGVSGKDFLLAYEHLRILRPPSIPKEIEMTQPVDHHIAFSIYFKDPYGYRFEVTTYDHGLVRRMLRL